MPRLTARFWVDAYLTRLRLQDIPAFVVAHGDDTGGAMLVIVPVLLFAMIFAACGLVSKRKQRVPDWPPPRIRRTDDRPVRGPVPLLKTKAERYQDLKEVLVRVWR